MTNRLLPVRVGEVELLVETVAVPGSEPTSRVREAGRQVVDSFDHARDAVVEIATSTAQAVGRLRERAAAPEQVEVEFGLKFSAQGNVIVAGASAEASLLVRMTYRTPTESARP
ncbi:CU044_2847 family protein [Streptomyces sp. NPDC051738]|uniref:CU044_2847 family protein n=1 Tax=Streptomyces sp. NPDC051738 TaxID=3365672 RepID=UPI0037D17CC9